MSYRGEDLDLRTTQTWSTASEKGAANEPPLGANGQRIIQRGDPILVDDTLLACSNHAYDIALAHRAGEVRIEHLIYALTRIDAAVDALEIRGVRVASLRREVATVVASEIPVGLPNGKGSPRRAEEFAEILWLASANAAKRNMPATVDDVLNVLFDQRSEFPASALLIRNLSRVTVDPMPAATRYYAEPRYAAPVFERYARPLAEPARYIVEPPQYRPEYAPAPAATQTDAIQNSRIEALEQMVRQLGTDLANERQTVANLLRDLSRETQAQRDDQGRMHTGVLDRMQTLEQAVSIAGAGGAPETFVQHLKAAEASLENKLREITATWQALSARLQNLEAAVRETGGVSVQQIKDAVDLQSIATRLDFIEEAVMNRESNEANKLADRLTAIEENISHLVTASTGHFETLISSAGSSEASTSVGESFATLTQSLDNLTDESSKSTAGMAERLTAIEAAIAAEIETTAAKHQAYTHDLTEMHEVLLKINQNQHTLAGSIDQWRSDAAGDVAALTNKLNASVVPGEMLNAFAGRMDVMNRMMVERYHRRHRFWYWLFGTDDWLGASWSSQVAAVNAEVEGNKEPQEQT